MSDIPLVPWFRRSFPSGLSLEMWLPTLERLRGAPVRVAALVAGADDARLHYRPEGWSAQEHVGHLADLEPVWFSRFVAMQAGEEMPAADLSNRRTHDAGHNDQPIDALVHAFASAREALLRHLEPYDAAAATRAAVHPRLRTPMSAVDLAFFVAEHDDHHLVQIRRLVRQQSAVAQG